VDWQAEGPKAQLAPESIGEITGPIPTAQPLTRADCDKMAMTWDDTANVCRLAQAASSEIALRPRLTAKMNRHNGKKRAAIQSTEPQSWDFFLPILPKKLAWNFPSPLDRGSHPG
jgi:hypothetical protein